MQTAHTNSTTSAYEVLNGQRIDWNRTVLAPVGQWVLTFLDPANHLIRALHTIDVYPLCIAPDYYRLLQFWIKLTGKPLITGTYAPYLAYCKQWLILE